MRIPGFFSQWGGVRIAGSDRPIRCHEHLHTSESAQAFVRLTEMLVAEFGIPPYAGDRTV
jgi:hypothetical protein